MVKPGGDGARKGKVGRAIADGAEQNADGIELPQMRAQQGERGDGATVDGQAGKNDPARPKAVKPLAEQGRPDRHRQGGQAEAARNGLAAPAELGAQGLHENAEGVNKQRAEPHHHAEARRQHHAPAVIAAVKLAQRDRG